MANEISGRDLTWFFDQVHRSANEFDYGVSSLTSVPVEIEGLDDDGRPLAPAGGSSRRSSGAAAYETTVVVRRLGEAVFPIDVAVVFENGERVREHWDGRDRWRAYRYRKASPAVSAEADPDRVLRLDVNQTNNGRTLAPAARQAAADLVVSVAHLAAGPATDVWLRLLAAHRSDRPHFFR